MVYLDDFMSEWVKLQNRKEIPALGIGANDGFPLLSLLRKMNYLISETKTETDRKKIEYTGFVLDFQNKTIGIKKTTTDKLKQKFEDAISVSKASIYSQRQVTRHIKADKLESILGILNFIAAISEFGLSKVLHMQLALIHGQQNGQTNIWVSPKMWAEIEYWLTLQTGKTISMTRFTAMHCTLVCPDRDLNVGFSDASSKMYGYKIFDEDKLLYSGAGKFDDSLFQKLADFGIEVPENVADIHINSLEFIAFLLMADKFKHNSVYLPLLDNTVVVQSFIKTRSMNAFANQILQKIFEILHERNIYVRPYWIPTYQMAVYGADDLSRGINSSLTKGIRISDSGFQFISSKFPGPFHLCFGAADGDRMPENWKFSSLHEQNHEKFVNLDPFQFMMKALDDDGLCGTNVIMPPPFLLEQTLDLLFRCVHQKRCLFLIIVPSSRLAQAKMKLKEKKNLRFTQFQGKNRAARLSKKTSEIYYLLQFGSDFEWV